MALLSILVLFFLPLLSFLLLKGKKKNGKGFKLPPSPPGLPIIGNLHQIGSLPHRTVAQLSKKYGQVMVLHFGRTPVVFVTTPEMAKEVLKNQDANMCSRPPLQGPRKISYNFKDISFTPYGEWWREIRKICALELLSPKAVQSYMFVREEEIALMVDSITKVSPAPVDLSEKLASITNKVISRTAFGKVYKGKDLDNGKLTEAVGEVLLCLNNFSREDFFPTFGWIINMLTGYTARIDRALHNMDKFFEKVIEYHLDSNRPKPDREDIIDVLLRLQRDQSSRVPITKDHIKGVLKDILLASVDTGGLSMVWAMTELARHPRVMKMVQAEIRSYVGNKGKVDESDIESLHFFRATLKESLRLHPPSPLLFARETMSDCKLDGYDIPNKTRIHVNVFAVQRDPRYWKNPDEYIPERFIDNPIDLNGRSYEYFPFSSGRRICPGITMGLAIVEPILANLLYSFDWKLPSGMTVEDINMEESFNLSVNKKTPLILVPIPYECKTA
ncbi:cytochrome P450 71B37-like [Macadamia integrifolia]|uniref:cytochrome P450 71B37-like n=1 Tax=Macadamia integrifolia TaxID=60698 RepID=UPI001C4EB8A2|nr:cytochrome P450 71B37-like [Macadamia integrifolia]